MGAQLPLGSVGAAAFAFAYSCISLICSGMLCWLTVVHREGWSYVFLLCVSTGVSTVMSLTQQARTIIFYEDIMWDQFNNKSGTNPELAIANGSRGIDLVLYYMQYWSYNVQALLVMFWAGELAQSVYGLTNRPKTRRVLKKVNITGKAVSFLFPALTILLLRVPSIQANFFGFIMLADLPLMISLAIGSLLMMAILVRYVKTKKGFTHWAPPSYQTSSSGGGGGGGGGGTVSSTAAQTEFSSTQYSSAAGAVRKPKSARRQGMHDRWLMVRFTVSFLILAVFEVTNILFQMQSINNLKKDSLLTQPDLSTERANTTFFLFLPGTTAGIFLMFVFGTTSGCRAKIREAFTPKSWQARRERRRAEKEGIAMSGRDLELNQQGVAADEYDLGSPSGKSGRIVRSSSVTVTYQNKGNGGSVALESLPPNARRSQYGRKMSFKSADDLLLESDGELNGDSDRDSTSDIIMPASAPDNKNDSNNTSKTTSSYRESLNKPLPNPNDPPIARIAHFQSITRPQNTHSRPQRSMTGGSIPEHQQGDSPSANHNDGSARTAMMNRHFAEHQRRQAPSQSQQQQQQQQSHQMQMQQAAQRTQALKRQWTHGNSSRTAAPQAAGTNPAVSPGGQLGEEYYGSSPEHSDDSGPVLPIMAAKRA